MGAYSRSPWFWRDELGFLNVLLLNKATISATPSSRKDIHKRTWQHPKSKRWHCIDFAIMKQTDHGKCIDAAVKRGAVPHQPSATEDQDYDDTRMDAH
jgi:hypothetical protein